MEMFIGFHGPHGSAKDVCKLWTLYLYLSKEFAGQVAEKINSCVQECRNSKGNMFYKTSNVNEWKPNTEGEIYIILALFVLMDIIQKLPSDCYHVFCLCFRQSMGTCLWLMHILPRTQSSCRRI
jgi:hypothetical protein